MYIMKPGTTTQQHGSWLLAPELIMPVFVYSALIVSSIEFAMVAGTPTLAVNAL